MRCVIIGDPNRVKKDQPLIDEAMSKFKDVVYAPITKVRFEIDDSKNNAIVSFEGSDLSEFDSIMVIPTVTYSELFYTAMWILNGKVTPIDEEKYLLIMNEDLMLRTLSSKGIPVRKQILVASNASLDQINDSLSYPAIVKPPKKKVLVTAMHTLKDVISLYKIGTPIAIETPVRAKRVVWIFVVGNEIVAGYEKSGKARENFSADEKLKGIVMKVKETLGFDYCSMRFLLGKDGWVLDRVSISPDFAKFQKTTGVDIARYIISSCSSETKGTKTWWHSKVDGLIRRGAQ